MHPIRALLYASAMSCGLVACAALGEIVGPSMAGRAVDDQTDKALEGVAVFRYIYVSIPFKGSACYVVVGGISDAKGAFTTSTASVDPRVLAQGTDIQYQAYKPGWELSRVTLAVYGVRFGMKLRAGSPDQQLESLQNLATALSCPHSPNPDVLQALEAMTKEAEQLAAGRKDLQHFVDFVRGDADDERTWLAERKAQPVESSK
jgi:hypothetical protein